MVRNHIHFHLKILQIYQIIISNSAWNYSLLVFSHLAWIQALWALWTWRRKNNLKMCFSRYLSDDLGDNISSRIIIFQSIPCSPLYGREFSIQKLNYRQVKIYFSVCLWYSQWDKKYLPAKWDTDNAQTWKNVPKKFCECNFILNIRSLEWMSQYELNLTWNFSRRDSLERAEWERTTIIIDTIVDQFITSFVYPLH